MKEIILIKNGELALKGLNRSTFEDILIKNIRKRIKPLGEFEYRKEQSTVSVVPMDEYIDMDEVSDRISRVFGIAAYSRALQVEKDMDVILEQAPIYLADQLKDAKTFKVEGKRADKKFPLKSPEISAQVGGAILSKFPHLKVDVRNPEILAEKAGEPIEGWYEFELLGYAGMRIVEQKTGDYRQSIVHLPEDELKGILDEIEYGEYIDKDLSIEELKDAFPKFAERFIAENEEYDLEGKLAAMDWGM